jgi:hypothetical protein
MPVDIRIGRLHPCAGFELLKRLGDRSRCTGIDCDTAGLQCCERFGANVTGENRVDIKAYNRFARLNPSALSSSEILAVIYNRKLAGLDINDDEEFSSTESGINLRLHVGAL